MTLLNGCAVGEWDACGNRFYSKAELYQMAWSDVNLDNLRCVHTFHKMFLICHGHQHMVLQPCQYKTSTKPGLHLWVCEMSSRTTMAVLFNVNATGYMHIGHRCMHAPYVNLCCAQATPYTSLVQNRQLCVSHTWVHNRFEQYCGESLVV